MFFIWQGAGRDKGPYTQSQCSKGKGWNEVEIRKGCLQQGKGRPAPFQFLLESLQGSEGASWVVEFSPHFRPK